MDDTARASRSVAQIVMVMMRQVAVVVAVFDVDGVGGCGGEQCAEEGSAPAVAGEQEGGFRDMRAFDDRAAAAGRAVIFTAT